MMIKTVVGDLLDATEDIIVQQVNCRSVMGSGVAKAIYTRCLRLRQNTTNSAGVLPPHMICLEKCS